MTLTGGCYCGAVRYEAQGPAMMRGQCLCRECQYISGGGPNLFMVLGADGFKYVKGEPARFTRTDLDQPVTREFCGTCGTPITSRVPRNPAMVILKIGTLDDQSQFEGPQMAIWMKDARPYHLVAEGVMQIPGAPG